MKKFELFALALLITIFLPAGSVVGYNLYLDPHEIMSKGADYPFVRRFPSRYKNAGIINNYEIDHLVIGGSLIQNMVPSEVKQVMGWEKSVFTLTAPGANVGTVSLMAQYALRKHDIKNVIFSIQPVRLATRSADEVNENAPHDFKLLYDRNPLNDLLIFFKLKHHADEHQKKKNMVRGLKQLFPEADKAGLFNASRDLYAPYMTRYKDFNRPLFISKKGLNKTAQALEVSNIHKEHFRNNFETHIRPLITNNPETVFYFVIQDMTFLKRKRYRSILSYTISNMVKELDRYPNVEIHSFADNAFNADLRLFKDLSHGHIEIERYELQSLKNGWDRLTLENTEQYVHQLENMLQNYEIPDLWKTEKRKRYPKKGYLTYHSAAQLVWGDKFSKKIFNTIPRSPYLSEHSYVSGVSTTSPPLNATRQELENGLVPQPP